MPKTPRMLEGYRVLDFTQFVAGPTCTRLLGEMGAEVIKLELAPAGDRVRADGLKSRLPEFEGSSHSTYYMQHNHSKLSFAIDMKKPGAREIVMSMRPRPTCCENVTFAPPDRRKLPSCTVRTRSFAGSYTMANVTVDSRCAPVIEIGMLYGPWPTRSGVAGVEMIT